MGGAHSSPTRKLSIPNEESNIIQVSESVAERLRRCTEKTPEDYMNQNEYKPLKDEPQNICPPSEFEENVKNKENIPNYPGDPLMNFYYGPSVTSLRILQEKEKELKESETYWTQRIQNMEKQHARLSHLKEEEFQKAIDEISSQSPRPPAGTPFPCCQQKQKLLECYTRNPKEILLCAGEVTEFADCVHLNRIEKERLQKSEKCIEEDKDKKSKKKSN